MKHSGMSKGMHVPNDKHLDEVVHTSNSCTGNISVLWEVKVLKFLDCWLAFPVALAAISKQAVVRTILNSDRSVPTLSKPPCFFLFESWVRLEHETQKG